MAPRDLLWGRILSWFVIKGFSFSILHTIYRRLHQKWRVHCWPCKFSMMYEPWRDGLFMRIEEVTGSGDSWTNWDVITWRWKPYFLGLCYPWAFVEMTWQVKKNIESRLTWQHETKYWRADVDAFRSLNELLLLVRDVFTNANSYDVWVGPGLNLIGRVWSQQLLLAESRSN